MSIEGQGHYLTLAQGRVHNKNSNRIFSETFGPFLTEFCMKAFRYKEMKICYHNPGHMTEMAATPIYGKNPSKFFFSGTEGPISTKLLPIIVCSNDDSGVTLTNFTSRSNLVTLAFSIRKSENSGFFRNYCSL